MLLCTTAPTHPPVPHTSCSRLLALLCCCCSKNSDPQQERNLCYTGMTRAKDHLCMTWAQQRRQYGRDQFTTPSCYITQILRAIDTGQLTGVVSNVTSGGAGTLTRQHVVTSHHTSTVKGFKGLDEAAALAIQHAAMTISRGVVRQLHTNRSVAHSTSRGSRFATERQHGCAKTPNVAHVTAKSHQHDENRSGSISSSSSLSLASTDSHPVMPIVRSHKARRSSQQRGRHSS